MNAQVISYDDKVVQFPSWKPTNADKNNDTLSETNTIKVKAPILDEEYLNSDKNRYNHIPVQPIPADYIELAKEYFHKPSRYRANNLRNYAYFVLSINIARRAGDVLSLKICDVLNEDGSFKDHIIIHEQKTKKRTAVYLNTKAREALSEYLNTKTDYFMSELLFKNYKTGNMLTVDGARKAIKRMTKAIGLDGNYGSHSLRKTFVTEAMNNNSDDVNIELMCSMALNHSDVKSTRHYMCQTQDEMDRFYEDNAL